MTELNLEDGTIPDLKRVRTLEALGGRNEFTEDTIKLLKDALVTAQSARVEAVMNALKADQAKGEDETP